ncbi:MAG: helix-turn-helix domain-containing protein [Kocuria sp.]|nr:helix-turn-helix domain-containing protein [Kocuria sp.]
MSNISKIFDEHDHAVMPNEAARFLGVATKTLANWRADGKGPQYVRLEGGSVVYVRDDLETYRDSQRVLPKSASTRRRSA